MLAPEFWHYQSDCSGHMTVDEYMLWYLAPCDKYTKMHPDKDIESAIVTASKQLGYSELRPNQRAAARSFLKGRDVFVCLPTGSGKSLCYCLLPYAFDILRRGETWTWFISTK